MSVSGFPEKLDSDFRSIFEDTGSLDCLEFIRSVGFLGQLNADNVFEYMRLFLQIKNGEPFPPPSFIGITKKQSILLEKKICDSTDEWFVHCRMVDIEGPYRVNRGTRVKYHKASSLQKSHNDLRNELLLNKILIKDENKLVFSRDYEFNSLSAAASVICGVNYDGWKVFKISGTNQLAATLRQ